MHRIRVFTDRYPWLGPLIYVLSLQFFIIQWLVAARWAAPGYSFSANVISDLGNTACGQYSGRFVCSPEHALMNSSFVALGITMAVGSMLIYHEFHRSRLSLIAFVLMGMSGAGTLLVGLFPENTIAVMHAIGAVLSLGVGNVSMILLAIAIKQARLIFRLYTALSGILALVAFGLFASGHYLGLGQGGMERLAGHPLTIWLILFGLYMMATRYRARTTLQK